MASSVAARAAARRPWVVGLVPPLGDALLAGVFVAGTLAEALTSQTVRSPLLHALFAVPAMTALAWRRRYPLAVAAAVMASNIVINPDGEFSTLLALVLVSFTLGAELDAPKKWLGLALVVVPFMAVMVFEELEPSDVTAALVFLAGPWATGVVLRQRSARTAEAVDRAARLEAERDAENAAAAAR